MPAIRKSAQSKDIKTEEIATLRGDESPKKSAISLPDENPAPIAVPIYNAAVLNDFFTRKTYENNGKIMINLAKLYKISLQIHVKKH